MFLGSRFVQAGGPVGSDWTSLYLSAEPIKSEYEDQPPFPNRPSASGSAKTEEGPRFQRKGVYSFKFSITAGEKLICVKEDVRSLSTTWLQNAALTRTHCVDIS